MEYEREDDRGGGGRGGDGDGGPGAGAAARLWHGIRARRAFAARLRFRRWRAEGLRVGFYHSVIDWHHGQYEYAKSKQLPHPLKGKPYPNGTRDHSKYVDFLHAQVNELISNYGTVDVLWWDYSAQDFQGDEAWRAMDLMAEVRAKQPGIVMNNRLFRNEAAGWKSMGTDGFASSLDTKYGDFITPEQHIPATGMPGVDWETCMTLNTTWGFSEHDHAWKSDETLIRNVVDIASKGGNYLLNIGPKGDGSVPAESVKSMKAIGAWMKPELLAFMVARRLR